MQSVKLKAINCKTIISTQENKSIGSICDGLQRTRKLHEQYIEEKYFVNRFIKWSQVVCQNPDL